MTYIAGTGGKTPTTWSVWLINSSAPSTVDGPYRRIDDNVFKSWKRQREYHVIQVWPSAWLMLVKKDQDTIFNAMLFVKES